MKKLILILSLALASCKQQTADEKKIGDGYKIKTIDGCQYITYENGVEYVDYHVFTITHKGNCNNPIHSK